MVCGSSVVAVLGVGRPPLYEDKREAVLLLLRQGYTVRATAHKTGVPKSIVGRMAKS
jgi:hypothetical protein